MLGTRLPGHGWARAARKGKLRPPRACRRNLEPWTVTCTWGHRACSESGRRDAQSARKAFQGQGACRAGTGPGGWQDRGTHATPPAAHVPAPLPCAQLSRRGPPTWGRPPLPGAAARERDFRHPGVFPPTSGCHLRCSANLSPETTRTFRNWPAPTSLPSPTAEKPQGPNSAPALRPGCPAPHLLRKDPSSCREPPRAGGGGVPAGLRHAHPALALTQRDTPPPPGLCPSPLAHALLQPGFFSPLPLCPWGSPLHSELRHKGH